MSTVAPGSGRPGAWPAASTRLVALLGWPVGHSLSPSMHNAAFADQGLDLVYLALPTPPEQLVTVVGALQAVGAVGANVTVPHKQAVRACCDHLSEEAALIGAVNTLTFTDDSIHGDNTDAVGLHEAFAAELSLAQRARFVLLGTGGAARAAAVAIGRCGAAVTVVGRRRDAAMQLADLAQAAGAGAASAVDLADDASTAAAVSTAATVVNATPLGLHGEALPSAFHQLRSDQVAYDLVYGPVDTPFLAAARRAGARAIDGLPMLLGQAAASFRRWTSLPAPVEVMDRALNAARTQD